MSTVPVVSDFVFSPVWGWPWLAAVAVAILAVIGWSLFYGLRSPRRRAVLWCWRGLALLGFLAVLAQPQKRHEEVTVLRPQLAVLVDTSESMADPVDEQQPRRADRVQEFFKSPTMMQARQDFDVRVFTFDQQLTETGDEPRRTVFKGDRSNIHGALRQVVDRFRGQPLAGVLLLSDGLDTVAGAQALESAPPSVPMFPFELEKQFKAKARTKRLSIISVDHPHRVVVGWEAEIKVVVNATGLSGQTIRLELWRDGERLQETTLAFGEDEQTRDVTLAVTHELAGMVQYELRIPDPAADKEAQNFPFLMEVIEAGNRVLYLQNTLGFDLKYLRQALGSDRNLQLVTYVRWPDNRLVLLSDRGPLAQKKALEFTAAALAKYAVIVLGDLPVAAIPPEGWQAIRDFVDRGGALVLLGGANSLGSGALAETPLRELLPVKLDAKTEYREGNFPTEITETGLHHPVFGALFAKLNDLPPLLTCDLVTDVAPTAEVLVQVNAGTARYPLIAANRFGQGRVVAVLTDTIWRWRLAAKSWVGTRSPYDTFWAQLMDWLIPKEQNKLADNRLELFTDKTSYLTGEQPDVRAILTTPAADSQRRVSVGLRVHTPDEKTFEYVLPPALLQTSDGRPVPGFRSSIDLTVPGVYRADATANVAGTNITATTRFVVTRPATEITGKPINRELLTQLAESSHGKFSSLGDWPAWRQNLHVEEQHFARVQLVDLWNHPWLLTFLLTMLAADWIVRKLWNLP